MKSRLIASLAIGAVVALGTTGCSLISPQGTTVQYSPSDGLNVPNDSGPLQVRNALIVANEDGSEGNLVAAIVNPTDSSRVLHIEVGEGSNATKTTIAVGPGMTRSLGMKDIEGVESFQGAEPLLIENLDTKPGATVTVFFQSGDSQGVRVQIPVLDATLSHLETLAP